MKDIKTIQTVMTTKFTGDKRAVASEIKIKKPDNPEEVIARNTICKDKNKKKSCTCS